MDELQQATLQEYGPDLHVALRSRRDELLYLRTLTEMLFPFVMPPKATDCRCVKPCWPKLLAVATAKWAGLCVWLCAQITGLADAGGHGRLRPPTNNGLHG